MSNEVRMFPVYNTIDKKNEVSGHEWKERGSLKGFDIVTPTGRYFYKSEKKATKELKEWQEFFNKYPFTPIRSERGNSQGKKTWIILLTL